MSAGPIDVPAILEKAAETFRQRDREYGSAYRDFGPLAAALFPRGLTLRTEGDWNRFGALFAIVMKLQRYANALPSGGHADSAHDVIVYAAMLEEFSK